MLVDLIIFVGENLAIDKRSCLQGDNLVGSKQSFRSLKDFGFPKWNCAVLIVFPGEVFRGQNQERQLINELFSGDVQSSLKGLNCL